MKTIFEHTIRAVSAIDKIEKSTLWQYLEWSVRHPHKFTEAMERSKVVESQTSEGVMVLNRMLDFGTLKVKDRVLLTPMESIRTEVRASNHWPAGAMTIKIEQPKEGGSIFLRFTYEEDREDEMGDDMISNLRRKAYEQKDRDMVELIRQKIQENSLSLN